MLDAILDFGGRLHPMVLHVPIGLLIGLAALELLGVARARPLAREVRLGLIWLAAVSAVVSVATGLLLERGGGYPEKTAQLHQWLAIAAACGSVLAAIAAQARAGAVYGLLLGIAAALLVPAGHLGASMTHGEDFLFEPFRAERKPAGQDGPPGAPAQEPSPVTSPESTYARLIAPILEGHCYSCHGATKHKGGLSLHTPQSIVEGGDTGVPIVPGDPDASDLVRRLRLPIDDEEHMPPRAKDQLAPAEIELLIAWIRAGASFDSTEDLGQAGSAVPQATQPAQATDAAVPPADEPAIAALRSRLFHVEPAFRGSPLLVIDASAVAGTVGDADVRELLGPVARQVSDLTLARTKLTDVSVELIASMPNLHRLNLGDTAVTDAGAARLAAHPALEELVLSRTKVGDAGLAALAAAPKLKRIFVWGAGVTPEGVARARQARPLLSIDAGDAPVATATESEAATPGAPEKAVSLKPVNSVCPVSGKPVDEGYALVFKGKVVGFCCGKCLGQFLESPAKFEDKLN